MDNLFILTFIWQDCNYPAFFSPCLVQSSSAGRQPFSSFPISAGDELKKKKKKPKSKPPNTFDLRTTELLIPSKRNMNSKFGE